MKICVKCQIELRAHENGIVALSMATFGPYELYLADIWRCPQCGWQGIFSNADPFSARHQDADFESVLDKAERTQTVVRFWLNQNEKGGSYLGCYSCYA